MKEHPILFSGPMVRAILDGRKTQTRRVIKPQPSCHYWERLQGHRQIVKLLPDSTGCHLYTYHELGDKRDAEQRIACPYGQVGDQLWVRETWHDGTGHGHALYAANAKELGNIKWKPSIHMPRWASRITLEATGVRVQRLQAITEDDAKAEGWTKQPDRSSDPQVHCDAARDWFMDLWDPTNEKRGYGWDSNPWVWVIEFRPC